MAFLLFMPSYNQAHYIVEAVRSVLAQDDPDWELWIVDNSTDATPAAMKQFDDPRIRFNHIAARMDPGSCLNWMLERAEGRDFSYIHTDNNLHPAYVRRMRAALSEHSLALAYCDMRTIDGRGRYVNVFRRGAFDLPRLLSADSLGVPFAATVELAKRIGGFSSSDLADDVRFCVSAYGVAHYVYVPEALLDYRLHESSRTEQAGGDHSIQDVLVKLMPKLVPTLEQRGVAVLPIVERAIRHRFGEIDLFAQDVWYRDLKSKPSWTMRANGADGLPRFDELYLSGLLSDNAFPRGQRPRWGGRLGGKMVLPWTALRIRLYFYLRRRELRRMLRAASHSVVAWGAIKLSGTRSVRLRDLDFRTVWAARQLQLKLGIVPTIDASVQAPSWLSWSVGTGAEPLFSCVDEVVLIDVEPATHVQNGAAA